MLGLTIGPETEFQLATAYRNRSFERIEQPGALAQIATPDRKAPVDLLGNGDPALTAALQLLADPDRWSTLLEEPTAEEESR